jgi:hypothetical protein
MARCSFRPRNRLVALVSLTVVLGAAWASRWTQRAGQEMTAAAQAFLESLSPEQRRKATFSFEDPERLNWHYIPMPRRGLSLKEMTEAQRKAAHALLHAGLSQVGYQKATTIMALEGVLHELEKGGRLVRDPELYYWSIFGNPGQKERWGWRVEGHHLSLNFVVENGRVVAATPAFFGANPALIQSDVGVGPPKGSRTLAQEELLPRQLMRSLEKTQRSKATLGAEAPSDIRAANSPQPPRFSPDGIRASELRPDQQQLLWQLIETYAAKMPEEVAQAWLGQIKTRGFDQVFFGWAGGLEPGEPHYYRIQSPDFLVEYCNVQPDSAGNPANHIHSVWRSLHGDFGLMQ